MNKNFLLTFVLFGLILTACASQVTETLTPAQEEAFELYLADGDAIQGAEVYAVPLNDLPLANAPVLTAADIERYDPANHAIYLTDEANQRIRSVLEAEDLPMNGVPFVVLSNGERIYAGSFWSPASSLSFDGVTIVGQPDQASAPLSITLGYPTSDFYTGEDPRSDSRLMQALADMGLID
jgi:hypothetical protein